MLCLQLRLEENGEQRVNITETTTDKLTKFLTYVIRKPGTPAFLTPNKTPVAPNSEFVLSADAKTPILRLTGEITQGAKKLSTHTLTIDAAHYRHPGTRIEVTPQNVINVTVPSFQTGRVKRERKLDKSAASVQQINSFFAKPSTGSAS